MIQTATQTALRLKTRTFGGKRIEIVVPELNDDEEIELIILRSATAETPTEPEKPKFASAWDYLQSLPPLNHTPEEWERIEREMRRERDAWGD